MFSMQWLIEHQGLVGLAAVAVIGFCLVLPDRFRVYGLGCFVVIAASGFWLGFAATALGALGCFFVGMPLANRRSGE